MMDSVNFFEDHVDGERYARARPCIHPTAFAKFRYFAGESERTFVFSGRIWYLQTITA